MQPSIPLRVPAGSRAILVCIAGCVLAGCAGNSTMPTQNSSRGGVVTGSCSTRVMVFVRQGTGIRSDLELIEAGRRLGVQLEVLQQMGRNSRMVIVRGVGPEEICIEAVEQLSLDPRIESVQRYY